MKSPRQEPGIFSLLVMAAVIAIVVVAPFFVCFVLVVPMVGVTVVMAGADVLLMIAFAAEMVVLPAVFIEVQVGLRFVDDYLVTVIEIEIPVTGRQVAGEDPAAFALINELVIGNIVVRLDVGDVVVLDVVVTSGTPGGLDTDVNGHMDLRVSWVGEGETGKDGACQKEIFHTF